MAPLRVKCNRCQKPFESALVERPEVAGQLDGAVIQEFVCPHCGFAYGVARISVHGLRLRRELATTPISRPGRRRRLMLALKREVTRL